MAPTDTMQYQLHSRLIDQAFATSAIVFAENSDTEIVRGDLNFQTNYM